MRALLTGAAAILCAAAPVPAAASPSPSAASTVAVAAAKAARYARDYQVIPGLQIAVVRDGRLVLDAGYGLRNVASGEPVTQNTLFEIGSITKQFTAAAILQLKERGKLKLTDRLGQYVPEYPRGKDITIEQMLHMTSGIPDHINDPPNAVKTISSSEGSLDASLALIANMPLHFKPGTRSEYSNTNYLLLGAIVARVSHMPFHDYISKNLFAPAHMVHSAFLNNESSLADMATGYELTPKTTLKVAGHIGYGWSGGAGSIVSTAGDVASWDEAFFNGRIVSAADVKLATAPLYIDGKSTGYAFGWNVDNVDGLPVVSHDGGMLGFTSTNEVFPTLGLSVIVLSNNGDASPEAIAKGIVAELNASFARARNTSAPNENAATSTLIAKVWVQLHEGTVDRSLLTAAFSNEVTPRVAAFMHAHFARLLRQGPPLRWIYKGKQLGDDGSTTYNYRVLFKGDVALAVSATIARNGKVAACDTAFD